MKGYLVDVNNGTANEVETNGSLEEYYKLLDCDCIDIVTRKIGGKYFCIVCDDEGLFVENPKISAIDSEGAPLLVGNLLVLNNGDDGDLHGLNESDIAILKKSTRRFSTRKYPVPYYMLFGLEY